MKTTKSDICPYKRRKERDEQGEQIVNDLIQIPVFSIFSVKHVWRCRKKADIQHIKNIQQLLVKVYPISDSHGN